MTAALEKEIKDIIDDIDPSKGKSSVIPPKLLKINNDICHQYITKIYNNGLIHSSYPSNLKMGEITPVHKKDETTNKENYRPISILPTVSKIFEKILYPQIYTYFNRKLSAKICGFRKGYGPLYTLLPLLEKFKKALDNHRSCGALLTDLSKAFDCLNHNLLIAKLHAYGFDYPSLHYITSYLKGRVQRTKIGATHSSWLALISGVPQGSILGPLLFNIYINDLFYFMGENEIANYADDNTPYSIDDDIDKVICNLKCDYLKFVKWLSANYMKDNKDKLQFLAPKLGGDISIDIDGKDIVGKKVVKLLGIKIDSNLRFDDHVSSLCKKASQKLHALARISTYMCSRKLKVLMKSFIMSQFGYCPIIWMFHSKILNHRINRIHERALRIAYKDHSSTFEHLLELDNSVTVHVRNLQMLATEMYKIVNDIAPVIMRSILPINENKRELRSNNPFLTHNIKSVYNGMETVSFRGPKTWLLVPDYIRASKSLNEFKSKIKKWTFTACTCRICKPYIQNVGFIN